MKFEENRETYSKIATLYYMGEFSQDEISTMFGISRFKVSRVLKKCKDLNIVEFHINKKPIYYEKLEQQVRSLLSVSQVTIVPPGSTQKESKTNVGRAASKFLCDNLHDGMVVGFDWGTTLQTMVREFCPTKAYPNCQFVQISGSIATQSIANAGYMDGHDIVMHLAAKAKANWSLFPAPYIVKNELLKTMLLEEPSIHKHVVLFEKIDIAFFSVASNQNEYRKTFYSNYLTPHEFDENAPPPNCGEIFSTIIHQDGRVLPSILTNRVLTIDLNTLKQISTVVVLATGNDKAPSLIAAANGKYYNHCIIDEIAALSVINYFETNEV